MICHREKFKGKKIESIGIMEFRFTQYVPS